jgi:hypothetical protein
LRELGTVLQVGDGIASLSGSRRTPRAPSRSIFATRVLDSVPIEKIAAFEAGLEDAIATACGGPVKHIEASGELSGPDRAELLAWLRARALPLQAPEKTLPEKK